MASSVERLRHGLDELVKLQAHYAKLLNMHDGGERIAFTSTDEWLKRLEWCEGFNNPTPSGGGEPDQLPGPQDRSDGGEEPRPRTPPLRVFNESDLPEEAPKCDGDGLIHEHDPLIGPSSIDCPGCEACMPTIPG